MFLGLDFDLVKREGCTEKHRYFLVQFDNLFGHSHKNVVKNEEHKFHRLRVKRICLRICVSISNCKTT